MADKKFKTGVDIQSTLKISSASNPQRALKLNASKEVVESIVTEAELEYLSGVTSSIQTQIDANTTAASDAQADATQALADAAAAQATADAAIPSSEKGSNNGVATLDAGGKVPASQLPNSVMEYKGSFDPSTATFTDAGGNAGDVYLASAAGSYDAGSGSITYAIGDWAVHNGTQFEKSLNSNAVVSVNGNTGAVVLDADDIDDSSTTNKFATQSQLDKVDYLTVTQAVDLDTLESDVASLNASSHSAVTLNADDATQQTLNLSGQEIQVNQATTSTDGAMSAEDKTKLDGIETGATADQTGAEIKAAYEAEADTNAFTDAEQTKLAGIEAGADVTDTANVDAAGATMNTDTDVSGNSWVLDEDDMVSDDATKVPTQQSVKAYVDNNSGNKAAGDITQTSFAFANNQSSAADVTGLSFANGTVRSFEAQVAIDRGADGYEVYKLLGIQKSASWDMSIESVGDDAGITFSITSAGQVRYISSNGTVGGTMLFRADTVSVS